MLFLIECIHLHENITNNQGDITVYLKITQLFRTFSVYNRRVFKSDTILFSKILAKISEKNILKSK